MMLRPALLALALALALPVASPPAAAEEVVAVQEVYGLLRIPELIEVMRDEGRDHGTTLAEQLFDDPDEPGWAETVSAIYEPGRMDRLFRAEFDRSLEGDVATQEAAGAFFSAEPGRTILGLEIEARRALLDEAVEEAATLAFHDMEERRDPRVAMLRRFAEANDLIDSNVAGALNANLAFLKAMAEAGGGGTGGGDAEAMLAEVWGQEAEVRAETEAWLFPFLALAYQPLSDADLEAYVAFSETPEGQRLNRALFAAFDALFTALSADLGRAAGLELRGQDI